MADKIIYHKGKLGSNFDWDDRALIKAYDEAVKSFKEKIQDDSTSEASQHDRKKGKRLKKKTLNNKELAKCQWNIGDKCMAKFSEDGLPYEATILSIDYAQELCRVKYSYYDNEEDQRWDDLQTVESNNPPANLNSHSNGHLDANDVSLEERCFSSRSRNSSLSSHNNSSLNHHLPQVPPPPLPDLSSITNETEALHGMLISWYMSGYYTGYYKGLQTSSKKM